MAKTKTKTTARKSVWDLYEDGLTQSSIKQFLECPHQFWLSYVEGWSQKLSKDAVEFGDAFHYIESEVCHGKPINKVASKYIKDVTKEGKLSLHETDALELLVGTVTVTLESYLTQWNSQDVKEWVAREKVFNVKREVLKGPQNFIVPLTGRWDGVFRNNAGKLMLFETKTKSRIDEEGLRDSLHLDIQTMLYCYAIRQVYGEEPAGVLYNVVRRSQLKQKQTESVRDYCQRVQADIAERPAWYFMRWETKLAKGDLDRWLQRCLDPALRRIIEWWDSVKGLKDPFLSPLHHLNPAALFNQYGRCSLFNYLTKGDTFGLVKRKVAFPELQD